MIDPGIEPGTFSGFIQLCERDVITTTPADLVVDVERFRSTHHDAQPEVSRSVPDGPTLVYLPISCSCIWKMS